MTSPMLAHDVFGDGSRAIVFLHGILGSRGNWRSFARRITDAGRVAVLADLRNHGESHGFAPPHTLETCAVDVAGLAKHLAETRGLAIDAVVGHSFGGKVALAIAARPWSGLREVWVLDAAPGPRAALDEAEPNSVGHVLVSVRSVPLPIASRQALVDALLARGLSRPIAQWMTTNLRPDPAGGEGFVWRFDLDAIPEMLTAFGAADYWPLLEGPRAGGASLAVHVVQAERGGRFGGEDVRRLRALQSRPDAAVRFHVLAGASHWLHTDDPEGLFAILAPTLLSP